MVCRRHPPGGLRGLQSLEACASLAFRGLLPATWDQSDARTLSNLVETIGFNGMVLDVAGHSLVDAGGREVRLTQGEFAILVALARRPGQVLSREQLLDAVSGRRADAFDRSIDNLIARLRGKIERHKKPRIIVTLRGVGYKFCARRDHLHAALPMGSAAPRHGILALPLADLGDGRNLRHFSAAVSAALRSELKSVVGAQIHYNDERANAHEVARQLGLGYIVRASVRQDDDRVSVVAQMTDAATGDPLWVGRFDGDLSDISGFQHEVTARVTRAIDLEFTDIEARRSLTRAGTPNADDLLKLGFAFLYRPRSPQNLARARGAIADTVNPSLGRYLCKGACTLSTTVRPFGERWNVV
jgi:TolB-like protein